jgi:flagellar P-ring protein FlgI
VARSQLNLMSGCGPRRVLRSIFFSLCASAMIVCLAPSAQADRLKDLTAIAGARTNQLVGYGLVVGLPGTGDGSGGQLALQSMQSMVSRLGQTAAVSDLKASNAASVMVTAELPAFIKPGQTLDVTVSTIGAAKSLRGGTLLMTPLLGADGETYAIAQGNLLVGGLSAEGLDGSTMVVNIPTVGRVPQGATVERMVDTAFLESDNIMMNLHRGDFSTAASVANAINAVFGPDVAVAIDSSSIRVRAPSDPAQRVSFVGMLENIEVDPAEPPAKVIVNARTGTIVIGGKVRVTPAAVSHGALTVKVSEDPTVSPQSTVSMNSTQTVVTPTEPIVTENSTIDVQQEDKPAFVFDAGVDLSSIVDAINAVGASPSDLVAILEALRAAGALRAELIII